MADVPLDWLEAMTAFLWPVGDSASERYMVRSHHLMRAYQIECRDGRRLPQWPDEILAELSLRRYGQSRPGAPLAHGDGPGRPRTWRVFGTAAEPEDFTGECKASEAAESIFAEGHPASVYRWKDGAWHLRMHLEPAHPLAAR